MGPAALEGSGRSGPSEASCSCPGGAQPDSFTIGLRAAAQISTMSLERLLGQSRLFGKRPAGDLEALVDTTGAGDFEAVLKLT